jgi:hypothetical protein
VSGHRQPYRNSGIADYFVQRDHGRHTVCHGKNEEFFVFLLQMGIEAVTLWQINVRWFGSKSGPASWAHSSEIEPDKEFPEVFRLSCTVWTRLSL